MPRTHPPYAPEYRRRIIELARAGRSIDQLAREFEPTANAFGKWVKQASLDEGLRSDGLTTTEREELTRLRRENRVLREEREILAKAAAPGLLRRPARRRHGVRVRKGQPGHARHCYHVPRTGRLRQRLLRAAHAATCGARPSGCGTERADRGHSSTLARHLWSSADSCGTGRRRNSRGLQAGSTADG